MSNTKAEQKNKNVPISASKQLILFLVGVITTFMCLLYATFAWFAIGTGDSSVNEFNVSIEGVTDVSYTIYRSDGVRFVSGSGIYAYDGATLDTTSSFSMLPYDKLITEKNSLNNLILKIVCNFDSSLDLSNKNLVVSISTANSSFDTAFSPTNGKYNLSSVADFRCMLGNTTLNAYTSSLDIYTKVTEAIASSS